MNLSARLLDYHSDNGGNKSVFVIFIFKATCKECRMACPPGQDFPRDNGGCPTVCECV